jgi:hypothetical protein
MIHTHVLIAAAWESEARRIPCGEPFLWPLRILGCSCHSLTPLRAESRGRASSKLVRSLKRNRTMPMMITRLRRAQRLMFLVGLSK